MVEVRSSSFVCLDHYLHEHCRLAELALAAGQELPVERKEIDNAMSHVLWQWGVFLLRAVKAVGERTIEQKEHCGYFQVKGTTARPGSDTLGCRTTRSFETSNSPRA